jgi:diguanylate cyclase (GGDEF)-like protein/PAS domain S-box-containing protein
MAERSSVTTDLTEILEAALGAFEECIGVLDADSRVLFWNHAAAAISGYQSAEMLARELPVGFYHEDRHPQAHHDFGFAERPLPVHLLHHQGHTFPAMLRRTALRNSLGKRAGTLLRFHSTDEIDALPHGEAEEDGVLEHHIQQSQAGLEQRLDVAWQEWRSAAVPFGLMWLTVDQAATLRRTHGRDACEAMLGIVERTLLHGLEHAEVLGRWGAHEFLVLCLEQTAETLEARARHLRETASTTEFRWWGDRIAISVSIGAAQAEKDETLSRLLIRAQGKMQSMLGADDVEN